MNETMLKFTKDIRLLKSNVYYIFRTILMFTKDIGILKKRL